MYLCENGVYLSSNNTIRDNTCDMNEDGISLHSAINNTICNNTCSNNDYGIVLYQWSSNNTLINNTCVNNQYGMYLGLESNDNIISWNCVCNNANYGVVLAFVTTFNIHHNRIWGNTFYYNNGAGDVYDPAHVQASDSGTCNSWNGTDGYGNYWSDWTGPDADVNGVVDEPYLLDGSAGVKDYYPLTILLLPPEPIPEFGSMPLVMMVLLVVVVLAREARRRNAH
jgi:parallel beta-helix repeat protein